MASQDVTKNNGQQLNVNTYRPAIFLGNNNTLKNQYTNNSSYDPITIYAGTVMGRISTSGIVVPCQSNASDGSQYPIGLLNNDLVLDSGESKYVEIVIDGSVAEEQVLFVKPGDNLETVVSSRSYRDRIAADTVGIILVPTEDNTEFTS